MMIPITRRVRVSWKQAVVSGHRRLSLQKTARVHILHRWIFQQTPFNGPSSLQNNEGITNVSFLQGDIFHPPFEPETFDHIFVCFVLEHLAEPQRALERLRPLLKKGGTITVIEGDHGSAFFHPESRYAQKAIDCLIHLQRDAGGNALIGRQLYPLLVDAGFGDVLVSPRMVYVDASRPTLVEGFTRLTFTAMIEGVGDAAHRQGLITKDEWEQGIRDLYQTAEHGGVFCYTFFKAYGIKP